MPRRSNVVRKEMVAIAHDDIDPDQEMLRHVGEQLYGSGWQSPLARDLGLSRRSVERWKFGLYKISHDRWAEVLEMLRKKIRTIETLQAEIQAYVADRP